MDNEDLKELNAIFKDMGGVDKVEDYTNNFERLADGTYIGEIEKVSTKNSKKTGRPMIEIIVAVDEKTKEYTYCNFDSVFNPDDRRNTGFPRCGK